MDAECGNKKIIITGCMLLFVVVISCFTLKINKNKKITDEERKLQSHADELNKYFGKKSYGIDNLNYTEIDPLAIVFSCDFDRERIGDEIVKTTKMLFDDYIGNNGEFIYRKKS